MLYFIVAVSVVCFAAIILMLLALALARRADRHFFGRRFDGNPYVHYWTAKDFDGLQAEPVSFLSASGQALRGFVYRQSGTAQRALIVFAHGYGAGHLAYTTEIAYLAKCGYVVLAFDVTGCGQSGGAALEGFDQGPLDLASAIEFAKTLPALGSLPLLLVGHSWGAFSVMNVLPFYPEVVGAVAMCGFVSGASVVAQTACKKFLFFAPLLTAWLRLFNRMRYKKSANRNSLRSLRRSAQPLLLLYGGEDATVFYPQNGARVGRAAKKRPHTRFFCYPKKGHNVYLSDEAESLLHRQLGHVPSAIRRDSEAARAYYDSLDYRKLTEEDEAVMQSIAAFLEDCIRKETPNRED